MPQECHIAWTLGPKAMVLQYPFTLFSLWGSLINLNSMTKGVSIIKGLLGSLVHFA